MDDSIVIQDTTLSIIIRPTHTQRGKTENANCPRYSLD